MKTSFFHLFLHGFPQKPSLDIVIHNISVKVKQQKKKRKNTQRKSNKNEPVCGKKKPLAMTILENA